MILNMSGGAKELAVKVVGGTVQPTGVAGMLWCNTATVIPSCACGHLPLLPAGKVHRGTAS